MTNEWPKEIADCPAMERHMGIQPPRVDRYAVALSAALLILEDVDTLPRSNMPVRLAMVIGHVLDAIYAAGQPS